MIKERDMNRMVRMFGHWYYWYRVDGVLELRRAHWLDEAS